MVVFTADAFKCTIYLCVCIDWSARLWNMRGEITISFRRYAGSITNREHPTPRYGWGRTAARLRACSPPSAPREGAAPCEGAGAGAWAGADAASALDAVIAENPTEWLGEASVAQFGKKLPFLLKLLTARRSLSIQAHPTLEQARAGYAQGNGIYNDANHKPELMMAITPFWAMCGFREQEEIDRLFSLGALRNVLSGLGCDSSREKLFRAIVTIGQSDTSKSARLLSEALPGVAGHVGVSASDIASLPAVPPHGTPEELLPYWWVLRLSQEYPGDLSVLSPLYLRTLCLPPRAGLYIAPGVPHAYLHGAGIEIMASSDNVLRGGLTPKAIHVDELLKIINYEAGEGVQRVDPEQAPGTNTRRYPTPAAEFSLRAITLGGRGSGGNGTTTTALSGGAKILFVYAGRGCTVTAGGETLTLHRGQSCFIKPEIRECTLEALPPDTASPPDSALPAENAAPDTEIVLGAPGI